MDNTGAHVKLTKPRFMFDESQKIAADFTFLILTSGTSSYSQ